MTLFFFFVLLLFGDVLFECFSLTCVVLPIFFIYLFLCLSIKESTVSTSKHTHTLLPTMGGDWTHSSVRVHEGKAGKVSGSKINQLSPPAGSYFCANFRDSVGLLSLRKSVVLPERHQREIYPLSQFYQGPALVLTQRIFVLSSTPQ